MSRLSLPAAAAVVLFTWATAAASPPGFFAIPLLPPRPPDVQDILYLTDQRPIRIRLHLTINGRHFENSWDEFMARLFAYADLNGDKVLSKTEAERIPQPRQLLNLLQGGIAFFPPNSH